MPTIASIGMVAKDAQGNQSSSWAQDNIRLVTVLNRMRRTNQMGNWDVSKPDNDGERELLDRAVKALETEFATKTCNKKIASKLVASEDCISRQAVLDMMQMRMSGKELFKAVYELPSVTPKQRTGHWIECEEEVKCFCSECKEISDYPTQFCPNCGAKMEEMKE
jgi:hypothetical protein